MDQKRFLVFIVVSMGILIGWNVFVMPHFLPPPKPKAALKQADKHDDDRQHADQKDPAGEKGLAVGPANAGDNENDAAPPVKLEGEEAAAAAEKPADDEVAGVKQDAREKVAANLPKFPDETVKLGSEDFASDYRQLVTLTSQGAAVQQIQLNDPRYRNLKKNPDKTHPPLVLVGEGDVRPRTFEIEVPQLKADVDRLNWKLVEVSPQEGPHSVAVFQLKLDDLEIVKRYELPKVDRKGENGAQQDEAPAYAMKVDLTFRNLGKLKRKVHYVLQGPTGLPIENIENTQKFRDVVVGFQSTPGAVDHESMSAKTIAGGKIEEWKQPLKYIGVDIQFFAALICPVPEQTPEVKYVDKVSQQLIGPKLDDKSEISVQLTSVDLSLEAADAADGKDAITHEYRLFAGPKRDDVLPPGAGRVIDYGTALGLFRIDWISRPMVSMLKTFSKIFGSWGFAIICLTIVVRGAMFPISIKTSRNAAKMQALKPELAALKEKYGNDKEKFARAQMELLSKRGANPLSGCLPLFLQLPIFIGLYQALNHAVDLRLASFLWIDNLAAPDAMFKMPFTIPFLGQEFNLLPLITIVLFVVQQKMFMPPPSNEQEAMQMKMMNYMMIFMGVMFYKVPAGLCVYFIASSLWGMGERKLLPKPKPGAPATPPAEPSQGRRKAPDADDDDKNAGGGGGLWSMLLKAAEKETSARRSSGDRRK